MGPTEDAPYTMEDYLLSSGEFNCYLFYWSRQVHSLPTHHQVEVQT